MLLALLSVARLFAETPNRDALLSALWRILAHERQAHADPVARFEPDFAGPGDDRPELFLIESVDLMLRVRGQKRPGQPEPNIGKPKMTKKLSAATFALALTLPAAALAMDSDGDGMVSLDEFQAAMPEAPAGTFEQLDSDGDGSLNADEVAAGQEAGILPA